MRRIAKRVLRPAYEVARRLIREAAREALDHDSVSQQVQRNIVNQYQSFKMTGILPYTKIRDAGFRVYSEFEEDGIILYVLSMIGFKTRRVVEMCCGAANECMATNLILNHGFNGYLFDGNQERIRAANEFFGRKHDCLLYPPVVTHAWITQRTMSTSCSHRAAAPAKSIYFHSIWMEMIIGFGTRYVQSTPACLFLKPRTSFLQTEVSQSNIGLIFTAGTSQ